MINFKCKDYQLDIETNLVIWQTKDETVSTTFRLIIDGKGSLKYSNLIPYSLHISEQTLISSNI